MRSPARLGIDTLDEMADKEKFFQVGDVLVDTGLQLRKSEQNGFHDNFIISQPNPVM